MRRKDLLTLMRIYKYETGPNASVYAIMRLLGVVPAGRVRFTIDNLGNMVTVSDEENKPGVI